VNRAPEHFFFYGTLQDRSLSETARAVLPHLERVGTGSVEGRLIAIQGENFIYPALVRDAGTARVRGTYFRMGPEFSEADLAALDAYEDFDPQQPDSSDYVRESVRLLLDDGGEILAWVYVWRGDAPPSSESIPSGDFLAYREALSKG
jgi:gamma-glutamylcyclotransferase (GGCT)/AIG2-like uncharacterized protein YtfP